MTPREVFAVLDSKRPKYIGGIHEDGIDRIMERRAELEAEGIKVA